MRYYTKFFSGIILGAGLLCVGMYYAALHLPTPTLEFTRWVAEGLALKTQIAESKPGPRLVILSGSNSLYGVSAKRIEETYHIPTVNLALHAGLGRSYIFHFGHQFARKGDIFVVPLEFELYADEKYQNTLYGQILAHDKEYFYQLPIKERFKLLSNITIGEWIRFVRNRIKPDVKSPYGFQSETINEYGDETDNLPDLNANQKIAPFQPVGQYVLQSQAKRDLRMLKAHLESVGATLVLAYPNILDTVLDVEKNKSFFEALKAFAERSQIQIIGKPNSRILPYPEFVVGTYYHPNRTGQLKSTDILIGQLKEIPVFEQLQLVKP